MAEDNDNNDSYEVGFGKPPKNTRFQKGVSGNPQGRPKGSSNLATILFKALQERVTINENGIRKTITKYEAALKQLTNKAASGDLAAIRMLAALAASAEGRSPETNTTKSILSDLDKTIAERFAAKVERIRRGKDGTDEKE